jgi:hypothetical protein
MQLISRMFGGLICGAVCFSAAFADDTTTTGPANVDQIPGNIAVIQQQNNGNTASIEQQAILGATYANEAVIQQYGTGGIASVTQQQGQQNAAGIAQYGIGDKASATQNGTNLGVQITQYSNGASIAVTQFGAGAPGAAPVTIKQY